MTTPRVGYTLDPTGQVGVQHANWDKADKLAGVIYTTSAIGVPPEVYEGCVVAEKDTGISYRMLGSPLIKHYINYPLLHQAKWVIPNYGAGTLGPGGWDQVDPVGVNNSDLKEAGTNAVKIKVKGIYKVHLHLLASGKSAWPAAFVNTDCGWYLNGNLSTWHQAYQVEPSRPFPTACQHLTFNHLFNVDDQIRPYFYNNTSIICDFTHTIRLSMLKPVF